MHVAMVLNQRRQMCADMATCLHKGWRFTTVMADKVRPVSAIAGRRRMNERRRSPRVTVEDAELTMGPFVTGVKVLDIGAGGVLLESGRRPQIGERGRLSLTL